MLERLNPEIGSDPDIEKFVSGVEEDYEKKAASFPPSHDKIDKLQALNGEREAQGQ